MKKGIALLTVIVTSLCAPTALSTQTAPAKFNGGALVQGVWSYKQTFEAMGQKFDALSTVSIAPRTDAGKTQFLVVDDTQTPTGSVIDSLWIDAQSLAPARRVVHQGPATVNIAMTGDSITGRIQAGPQDIPIRIKSDGPVYMDGGAFSLALSTLPLKSGYVATYREFDVMGMKTSTRNIAVGVIEKVTVPAGTFDAFKVAVTNADGSTGSSTYWIESKAPHRVVRLQAVLPEGMGTLLSELVK